MCILIQEASIEDISPAVARAIVLRRFPRVLRAALDPAAAEGPLCVEFVGDADAVRPGLGAELAAWALEFVGPFGGLARWLGDPLPGPAVRADDPAGGGLAALDRAAATADDPVLREVGDALLMLGSFDRLAPLADRAAAAAWACLDRLTEVGVALHQLGLASAGSQSGSAAVSAPWPNLDHTDAPSCEPDAGERAWKAWRSDIDEALASLCKEARLVAIGLSAIAGGCAVSVWRNDQLGAIALGVGRAVAEPLTLAASREGRAYEREQARLAIEVLQERLRGHEATPAPGKQIDVEGDASGGEVGQVPPGHAMVCPRVARTGAGKAKELMRGYEHAIGMALPLVSAPSLAEARAALAAEFPYAVPAVDMALGAFAGRTYVHAPPLLVVGPPGAGKSRFVRRLGEALGVGVFRVDGSNDGGGSFGGTERRWYSAEPCRPFMAVARHRQANPIVLVDEIDKASTRSDYGRLWDSILMSLDPETACRFPDPCLQVELDLRWVTVACTANDASRLPGPLLDRLRIVRFPEPKAEHLDALLPGVLTAIADDDGLDPRFVSPMDGMERAALRQRWRGGSVRRLRRAVEAVLRVRDRTLAAKPQ
ncbi:AAA family ATPase [Methylobacterium mesophilicum]